MAHMVEPGILAIASGSENCPWSGGRLFGLIRDPSSSRPFLLVLRDSAGKDFPQAACFCDSLSSRAEFRCRELAVLPYVYWLPSADVPDRQASTADAPLDDELVAAASGATAGASAAADPQADFARRLGQLMCKAEEHERRGYYASMRLPRGKNWFTCWPSITVPSPGRLAAPACAGARPAAARVELGPKGQE